MTDSSFADTRFQKLPDPGSIELGESAALRLAAISGLPATSLKGLRLAEVAR